MKIVIETDGTISGTHLIVGGKDLTQEIPISDLLFSASHLSGEAMVAIHEVKDSRKDNEGKVFLIPKYIKDGKIIQHPYSQAKDIGKCYPFLLGRK